MAQIINTNVPSLIAQRNLSKSSDAMATAIQRLSSGLKINSAKDDAAGLAITTNMTSQIRGMDQAVKNANDGISLAQVAEGAMQESTDILQRMRELALQSSNGTYSQANRQALQDEVNNLLNEMDNIAYSTQFNGQTLLNGSYTNASLQIGANAGETITFSINSIASSDIGHIAYQQGAEVSGNAATDITIALGSNAAVNISSSANYVGTANGQDNTSAFAKAAAINAAGISGLTVTASTTGSATVGAIGGAAGNTYNLSINGVDVFVNQDVSTALSNDALMGAINAASDQTGVVAKLNGGTMTLTAADGRNIDVVESGTGFTAGTNGLSVTGGSFDAILRGNITISADQAITIGGTASDIGLASNISLDTLGVNSVDITTQDGAEKAILRISSALDRITTNRSSLGALQNRLDATVNNLQNVSDNMSAARSRIQDTDYAAEMANLTKNQILQQAGTAMLAQANALPQSVLSLLG
ncbi:flagellin [Fluoribacter dumoffii]|uniref:flagellin N-terminal helical domain-containing protein n=1 Tax=Fluoribacter dumoffii TaxID=463 RepID=UPI0022431113|nr:flagellin [Fluoribacter dumoffii]MCW8418399.1 flagellin [Fluoribacter dumoffii]MCW8453759.1 flagellin [Fluoribacter dumoffii]MCW8462170.1 flagellin [Fluoribacter dumoffii]MCW8482382.1 flagellin [Fluoribacter dumoffii]